VQKYCTTGQATENNMAHPHCMLDTYGYKCRLRMLLTLIAFSTALLVVRNRLNVTLQYTFSLVVTTVTLGVQQRLVLFLYTYIFLVHSCLFRLLVFHFSLIFVMRSKPCNSSYIVCQGHCFMLCDIPFKIL